MAWDRNNVGLRDSRDCFWGVLRQQGRYSGRGTTVSTVNLLRFLGLVSEKGLFITPYKYVLESLVGHVHGHGGGLLTRNQL